MSEIINFATIVLAALVHASLQLGLGCLLLLYHESLAKHIKPKTRRLVTCFIAGVSVAVFLILGTACFVVDVVFGGSLILPALAGVIGILLALAFVMWFFYYRRGYSTELWLPKSVARFIDHRARLTSSNTEAFSLGALSCFAEMPFIAILVLVAGNSILRLESSLRLPAAILYTFITITPLLVLRFAIRSGRSLADIQKWRIRNKSFQGTFSGSAFIAHALFLLAIQVFGGAEY